MLFTWVDVIFSGILILLAIGIFILNIETLLNKSSPFNRNQKIKLSILMIFIIIFTCFLIRMLPTHDRNIIMIIVGVFICTWSIYGFLWGNRKNVSEYPQSAGIMILGLAIIIIFYGFDYIYPVNDVSQFNELLNQFVSDFYANSGAELISIALTVIVLDRLNERRNMKERLDELIVQMQSPDKNRAIEAIQQLDAKGWLDDVFTTDTLLPDGSKWTDERDMREFTHPRLWQREQQIKERARFIDIPESVGDFI